MHLALSVKGENMLSAKHIAQEANADIEQLKAGADVKRSKAMRPHGAGNVVFNTLAGAHNSKITTLTQIGHQHQYNNCTVIHGDSSQSKSSQPQSEAILLQANLQKTIMQESYAIFQTGVSLRQKMSEICIVPDPALVKELASLLLNNRALAPEQLLFKELIKITSSVAAIAFDSTSKKQWLDFLFSVAKIGPYGNGRGIVNLITNATLILQHYKHTPYLEWQQGQALPIKELKELFGYLVHGQTVQAVQLVARNPQALLMTGELQDCADRIFHDITALEYTFWSLDLRSLTQFKPHLEKIAPGKFQEYLVLWCSRSHYQYGQHVDLRELLQAYNTYIRDSNSWDIQKRKKFSAESIGGAQRKLPASILKDCFTFADRRVVDQAFLDQTTLLKEHASYGLDWLLNLQVAGTRLGAGWCVARHHHGGSAMPWLAQAGNEALSGNIGYLQRDFDAITLLHNTRSQQLQKLLGLDVRFSSNIRSTRRMGRGGNYDG